MVVYTTAKSPFMDNSLYMDEKLTWLQTWWHFFEGEFWKSSFLGNLKPLDNLKPSGEPQFE